MESMHLETECKLVAPDANSLASLSGVLNEICQKTRNIGLELIKDVYYDTSDWHFYRKGVACRARCVGESCKFTLKSFDNSNSGISIRKEFHVSVSPSFVQEVVIPTTEEAFQKLRSIAGDQPLRRLFTVRNSRRTFEVTFGSRLLAHVCADEFTLCAGNNCRNLAEIEIELVKGEMQDMRRLAECLRMRLALSDEVRSKFQQGLALVGLVPPEPGLK